MREAVFNISQNNRPEGVSEAYKPHRTGGTSQLIFLLSALEPLAASKHNMTVFLRV